MQTDADVIVVGSGPSGVSVAFPLLEAGMRVLLVDGGRERDPSLLPRGAYHDVRREDPEQWRLFLGPRLEALRPAGPPSPKFDAPGSRFAFDDFAAEQPVDADDFAAIGSLARGGLSNIWGAGVSTYGPEDLAEFPLEPSDLSDSYRRVAERIGVTGFEPDDLAAELDAEIPSLPAMRLAENARRILDRYERRRASVNAVGLRVGRPRAAVLTEPRPGREACKLCDMCIWGCRHESIYSATHDLDALVRFEKLDYRPGTLAEHIDTADGGYVLRGRVRGGGDVALRAPRIVLAAGALTTTRLVMAMQDRFGQEVPVVGAPGMGFAVCLPERLGAELSTREFSMAQLSFSVDGDDPGDRAYGSFFAASGVPGSMVIEHMPLSRPGAVRLFRYLQPSLLLGNCFLPGRYSRNVARLERDADGRARLAVRGGVADAHPQRMARVRSELARGFRKLGAWVVPRSFKPIRPGEEIRYSGTLPMRQTPGPGEVDSAGELHGSPGLHVVDLSAFPAMPAKHHTLTLMANADRVGTIIGGRWRTARA